MASNVVISTEALIAKFQYALDNEWGYIWGTAGIKWSAEKQAAATRAMTVKYGKRWIGHYVADCSGLFSWAFKQLGGYIYHGSNTMYKSYCTNKGMILPETVLKPGTAVFTGTEDDHGHVGLYIGNGEVIEAKGTQSGVVKSKLDERTKAGGRRWTYWGELKGVDYGDTPAEPVPEDPTGESYPTLRKGNKGEFVTLAQTMLINKGYDLSPYGADGSFGSTTENAVKQFQQDWDLNQDGIIGPKTWKMLQSVPTRVLYTVRIPYLTVDQADALIQRYPGATKEAERR